MRFQQTTFTESKDYYLAYYWSLNGGFDDYIEDMLVVGTHVNVLLDDTIIGVFAINQEHKLLCIVLEGRYSQYYEDVFDQAIIYGKVSGILTSTNDPLMMASIIRRNIPFQKQAYNFVLKKEPTQSPRILEYRLAKEEDAEALEELFKDFFQEYKELAKKHALYIGSLQGKIISLGHIKHHTLSKDTVSIGMIVREDERRKGYATDTISFLIQEGLRRKTTIQAGCWYYNHGSKKTLTKAGLEVVSILVRADTL
jgi:RimJ/RimL family protein N-acetyltransferase